MYQLSSIKVMVLSSCITIVCVCVYNIYIIIPSFIGEFHFLSTAHNQSQRIGCSPAGASAASFSLVSISSWFEEAARGEGNEGVAPGVKVHPAHPPLEWEEFGAKIYAEIHYLYHYHRGGNCIIIMLYAAQSDLIQLVLCVCDQVGQFLIPVRLKHKHLNVGCRVTRRCHAHFHPDVCRAWKSQVIMVGSY